MKMSDPLDKHFTIKPASQILPEREPYKEGNFTDACDALKRLWSKYDINMGHHYKKGEMLASAREIYGQDDYGVYFNVRGKI